jgi:Fic/DOC family
MSEVRGLPLRPRASALERRLATLLAQRCRSAEDPDLGEIVEDAWLLGSLELSGLGASWEEVRQSRRDGGGPEAVRAMRRARSAVGTADPVSVRAICDWHAALIGPVGFRRTPRQRAGAPPAPPELIEGRLDLLEAWLDTPSARDLQAEPAAAVVLARIVEILPFEDGNGRVSRLAASHVMVHRGRRPPILVAADGPRLVACLEAALRLETAPLVALLEEASARCVDVMIQALQREL